MNFENNYVYKIKKNTHMKYVQSKLLYSYKFNLNI
jgi:hypothetical protein